MHKRIIIAGIIFILFIAGCTQKQGAEENVINKVGNQEIANPASELCVSVGGSFEILNNPDGSQTGNCTCESGIECEEWEFYRGDCNCNE